MSATRDTLATPQTWARPGPPARALDEVRTRRVFALILDLLLITVLFLVFLVALTVLGLVTFGLFWLFIPILFPVIALFYNGLSVSGWRMATLGMRTFGLEMRLTNGTRVPFLNAAAHAVFFYLSWTILTPLVFIVSFVAEDKRCLHDMLAGVVVTRRL